MLGYTNVYAPILDVGRDQRWGRYEEVYGESPYLVAELGIEMVRGLQHNHQVAATGKHFAAYSNNKGAREGMARVDPQMSPREVENIHIYPFKRVIREAGMLGVMSSYNDYDGIPVQGSYYWLTTRLRGEMGFRGYVVSDSDAVEYLYTKHGTAKDMKEAVRQSVEAGLNVRCTFRSPDSFVLPLRELVKEGGLSEEVINDRVRDILKIAQEPVSLETPIGEEEDSHLGDFIQDDDVPAPSEAATFMLLKEQLVDVLSTLTPREEKVLRLRFGLDDGRARTLEEVGKEFEVTRERIRQIEAKALRKLRHPSRSKKLKDYLE